MSEETALEILKTLKDCKEAIQGLGFAMMFMLAAIFAILLWRTYDYESSNRNQ